MISKVISASNVLCMPFSNGYIVSSGNSIVLLPLTYIKNKTNKQKNGNNGKINSFLICLSIFSSERVFVKVCVYASVWSMCLCRMLYSDLKALK